MKGKFIVLEGPDGSGTSHHTKLLAAYLEEQGHDVVLTMEPTDGAIGKQIRTMLESGNIGSPDAIQLLFCADRAEHLASVVLPALAAGKTVVSDRYSPSTIVYGKALGLDAEWLQEVNRTFLPPDTLIFTMPPFEVCVERIERRETKDSFEKRDFQQKVYDAYEELLTQDPSIIKLDTSGSLEEVAKELQQYFL